MIRSLQNIALAIVVISALSLASSFAINFANCPATSNCLAAVSFYKINYSQNSTISQSTPATSPTIAPVSEVTFDEVAQATQVVSTYSLAIAIIIMIVLEAFELRYFHFFLAAKRRRATGSRR
jgi:uncharacterized membrane protein